MLQAWVTGSGRQVYCYQAGIIQKQHKKLDASTKKIRSSADTSARAIYQPMPPLFNYTSASRDLTLTDPDGRCALACGGGRGGPGVGRRGSARGGGTPGACGGGTPGVGAQGRAPGA